MLLLRRLKGTLTPITVENAKAPEPEPEFCQLRHVLPEVQTEPATFSRLVADTWEHQMSSLADEEAAVRAVAEETKSCGEEEWFPYIEEALRSLAERKEKMGSRPPRRSAPRTISEDKSHQVEASIAPTPSTSPDGCVIIEDHDGHHQTATNTPGDWSYFFQSNDGQYVFLHPLNMRCLMAEAEGQFHRLPGHVSGKVLEVETISLTGELRGRYSFLKHLPLYCSIMLVELDLKPFLSEATYSQFKAEIKKRQQKRKSRERAEARAKKGGSSGDGIGRDEMEEKIQELRSRQGSVDLTGKIWWRTYMHASGRTTTKFGLCGCLTGPSPLEAMLMGEEKDPSKVWTPTTSEIAVSAEDGEGSPQPEGDESEYMMAKWAVGSMWQALICWHFVYHLLCMLWCRAWVLC